MIEHKNENTLEPAVIITIDGEKVGYVNRGLIPTFINWIENNRIEGAWVEKLNETPERPSLYLFVKIKPH